MAKRVEEAIVRTVSDSMSRTLSGKSDGAELVVEAGDKCEPLIIMKVRAGQDFSTPVVGEVCLGTVMHVTEVGSGDRIKISTSKVAGWISYQTEMGHPLLKMVQKGRAKRRSRIFTSEGSAGEAPSESTFSVQHNPLMPAAGIFARGELAAGDKGVTLVAMNLREGELFSSKVIGQIEQGAQFEVACVGASDRIKIVCGNVVGWISAKAEGDRPLVQKQQEKKRNSFYKKISFAPAEETNGNHSSNGSVSTVASASLLPEKPATVPQPEERQAPPERPPLTLPVGKSRPPPPSIWKRFLCCSA